LKFVIYDAVNLEMRVV